MDALVATRAAVLPVLFQLAGGLSFSFFPLVKSQPVDAFSFYTKLKTKENLWRYFYRTGPCDAPDLSPPCLVPSATDVR